MAAPKKTAKAKAAATNNKPAAKGVKSAVSPGATAAKTRGVQPADVPKIRLSRHAFADGYEDAHAERGIAPSPELMADMRRRAQSILTNDEVRARLENEMVVAFALRSDFAPPIEPNAVMTTTIKVDASPEPWAMSSAASETLSWAREGQPESVRGLVFPLMQFGAEALLKAAVDLVATADPADLETNTLSWIGNRVSYHLRRALLLHELTVAGWNLTVAAEKLRLGGPGNVVRLIRELDLRDEQKAAQRAGLGRVGGARPRVVVSKTDSG